MELVKHLKAALEVHWHPKRSATTHRQWAEQQLIATVKQAACDVPYYRDAFARAGVDLERFTAGDLHTLPFLPRASCRRIFRIACWQTAPGWMTASIRPPRGHRERR